MNQLKNGTVLVVDDEAADLDILFELLREANFHVLVAEDGVSALEQVKRLPPDIALLEMNLPDINGLELFSRLKAVEALKDMPIIFLTINNKVSDKVKGLKMGAVDYITKPFAPEEVLARVGKHLAIHKLQVQLERQNAQLQLENAKLKRWEERNRSLLQLLDTVDASCFIKNTDGIYQYINKGLETQFGVRREEVIGKGDEFIFGPEIAASLRENDQHIIDTKMPEAVEEAGVLLDGKFVVYLTNKTPILDENGEVSGICGVGIDITARKEIEEQLRLSEEKYRVLVEHSHDVVYAVAPDGEIEYISPQITHFGYTQEDVIGKKVAQFIAPEQREETWHSFTTLIRTGGTTPVQFQWLGKEGVRNWVEVSAQNVYDDSGQPIQRVGVMRNITERMQMQETLRESEAMTRALLNASTASALLIEPDGTVVAMNESLALSLGQTMENLIGRNIYAVLPANLAQARETKGKEVIRTGKPVRFEDMRGGRWFDNHVYPVLDKAGHVKRLAIYANDITERKQAEQYLEKAAVTAERERLARDLHDAVTQSLFMSASIAETLPQVWERKPDEARRGLDQLRQLTMGALAEMRNMLIELNPTALTEKTLGVLLKQMCDGLMARTNMLVTISVAGDCHLPDEVQIALYRIAQEALNNIVKHAHARRAVVRLDCTPDWAHLSIEDNGRGFVSGAVRSDQMGLRNMSERAQGIGAEFKLDSELGQGTEVGVIWGKQN